MTFSCDKKPSAPGIYWVTDRKTVCPALVYEGQSISVGTKMKVVLPGDAFHYSLNSPVLTLDWGDRVAEITCLPFGLMSGGQSTPRPTEPVALTD
ncbi:MAG TPA: hypothetical protein PLU95_08205 [Syntrophales bacterium]|jgi:hypothetical protein|nr:hypothetical protein [Syntrophales bacterium]HPX82045.1 hypothetical protein [Syntrophales bacterium]